MASPREGTGAFGLRCGHCQSPMRIRKSDGRHTCLRILYLQCSKVTCGATFRATLEVTHQYNQSGEPNAAFNLPTTPQHLRMEDMRALAAQHEKNQLDFLDESEPETATEGSRLS